MIKDFFSRWRVMLFVGLICIILWLLLQYNLHEELQILPIKTLSLELLSRLLELVLFLLILKVVLGSNAVLNSIDLIFKNIYFKRDFLKTLKHKHLLDIANDIHAIDSTLVITDEIQKRNAYQAIKRYWHNNNTETSKPYVVLESHYTDTLYSDGQLIIHKKYLIKMMKTDNFNMMYYYRPFDKFINDDIEQEEYNINQPGNRWNEKSFKHRIINAVPAKINLQKIDIDGKKYLSFEFTTQRKIQKNKEFILEFSMTDKINLDDSPESIKRRNEYFKINFTSMVHGIRNIKFQLESYNNSHLDNKLPFEPILLIDGVESNTTLHIQDETIYYKQWSWSIFKQDKDPKNIKFELHEKD